MASRETDSLPPDCKCITIMTTTTYLTLSIGYGHQRTQEANPTTWQEFQNLLPPKQKWVFKHLNLTSEGQPLIQAIMSGHAVAISNGSFKDGQGTAAWMFSDLREPKSL